MAAQQAWAYYAKKQSKGQTKLSFQQEEREQK